MSLFNSTVLTIKRHEAGSYVRGKWSDGIESTFLASGSLQPTTGNKIATLLEGKRVTKLYAFYTRTKLLQADPATQRTGDRVIIDGENFEVFHVKPWQNGLINHYECYLIRENELGS